LAQPGATVGEQRWETALGIVLQGGQIPHDHLHVTAILEMAGYNDRRAQQEFGYNDLFDMGEELFRQAQARVSVRKAEKMQWFAWHHWLWLGFIYFLRGLMFAMPMVVSVFAMLKVRYSLWSSVEFGSEQATGIALGTMGSFFVTGGFTQAMARRGLFYISQREYTLARRTSLRLMVVGMGVSILAGFGFGLLNLVIPFFPMRLISFAAPYYFFLCLLWLTITILYMLQQELLFTTITAAGIALVGYLFQYRHWVSIQRAQMIGLGSSTLVSLILAIWLFRRYERRADAGSGDNQFPRWSQVVRALVPYFVFGALYFFFLYLDRLLAWSAPSDFHPLPIWFDGPYELGLDWAILTLVAPLGLLELFINLFMKRLDHEVTVTPGVNWEHFNRRFQKLYVKQLVVLLVMSAISGWLVWLVIGPLKAFGYLDVQVFDAPVTQFVFFIGAIAYVFLSIGLMNCLTLFSLNDPWPAVRSIGIAILVNLLVGFLLSREIASKYAVIGLLVGSIVFAAVGSIQVYRQLGRLDYILYRSV
jgi:hypothetical protein